MHRKPCGSVEQKVICWEHTLINKRWVNYYNADTESKESHWGKISRRGLQSPSPSSGATHKPHFYIFNSLWADVVQKCKFIYPFHPFLTTSPFVCLYVCVFTHKSQFSFLQMHVFGLWVEARSPQWESIQTQREHANSTQNSPWQPGDSVRVNKELQEHPYLNVRRNVPHTPFTLESSHSKVT